MDRKPVARRLRPDVIGLLLLLGLVAATAAGIGRTSLWGPTEPRVIEIAREQYADNGLLGVPTFGGKPFLEKPFLYFSHVALHFHLFGEPSVLAARLATLFWSLLWLAATMAVVHRAAGPRAGLLAGCLLVSAPLFFRLSRRVQLDVAFAAWQMLALLFFLEAVRSRGARVARGPWLACMACAGLSTLVKGLLGLFVFMLPALAYLAWSRDRRLIRGFFRPVALALLLGPGIAWGVRLHQAGGWPYVFETYVNNTVGRFLHCQFELPEGQTLPYSDVGGTRPWWYYAERLPGVSGAAALIAPFALASLLRRRGRLHRGRLRTTGRVAFCWAVIPAVALSFSSQKGVQHLGVSVTGVVVLAALWLDHVMRRERRPARPSAAWTLAAVTGSLAPLALLASLLGAFDTAVAALVAGIAAGACGLGGLAVGLRTRRYRLGAFGLGSAILALLVIGFTPGLTAETDRDRSLDRFAAWLASEVGDAPVAVFFSGDHDLGAVCWACQRNVDTVGGLEEEEETAAYQEAAAYLAAPGVRYLVFRRVKQEKIMDALARARVEGVRVFAEGGLESRCYTVLANAAAAERTPLPRSRPPWPPRNRTEEEKSHEPD
jgi:4-amino-4-deoxy-L-arabinose transferase-like glycosyltransferase